MKIRTTYIYPPIPIRDFDWSAVDDVTYDGAEDSSNRHMVGYGATEQEAIVDLKRLMNEVADWAAIEDESARSFAA